MADREDSGGSRGRRRGIVLCLTSGVAQADGPSADVFVAQVAMSPIGPIKLTVGNNGPDAATGVSLDDALDFSGSFFGGLSGSDALSCTVDADGLGFECPFGELAVGETREVVIGFDLQCGGAGNSAMVTASTADDNTANNSSAASISQTCTEVEPCEALGFPCGDPCYDQQTGAYQCSECTPEPPTVAAGDDQDVDEGGLVTLAGDVTLGHDCNPSGGVVWTQVAGPQVLLDDPYSLAPSFTAPAVAGDVTLTFELAIDDVSDTVDVVVHDLNAPPTVAAVAGGSCGSPTSGSLALLVGDDANPGGLIVQASASGLAIASATIGGSGANRTLGVTVSPSKAPRTGDVTISVSDGVNLPATLVVHVIVGINGKDTIVGSADSDMIFGINGVDTIDAGAASDLVCSGNGSGVITGGAGDDTIDGQLGPDVIVDGDGNDTMTGGLGPDSFSGGAGADVITDFSLAQGDTTDGT